MLHVFTFLDSQRILETLCLPSPRSCHFYFKKVQFESLRKEKFDKKYISFLVPSENTFSFPFYTLSLQNIFERTVSSKSRATTIYHNL